MKGIGPNLIEKILFQTIFVLNGRLVENYELNADNSTKMCLDKINMLLDAYAPLKRIKYKLKFKSKPWITLDLQKSISVKTNYLQITLIRGTLY